jgi:hypothetical protein
MRPVARTDGLVVREIGDETLVYDTLHHQAHCLNRTAAHIFRRCDGSQTASEIAAELCGGAPTDAEREAVEIALERLAEASLLATGPGAARRDGPSRREVIRRVGIGAALLAPIVTSLLVPTPAEAGATCIPEASCTTAKFGQPCYRTGSSTVDCPSYECKSGPPGVCGPI